MRPVRNSAKAAIVEDGRLLATIEQARLYPAALRPLLARMAASVETPVLAGVYLGDVN